MTTVFVPSSGRPTSSTLTTLVSEGIRPVVVIAAAEHAAYRAQFGREVDYLPHDAFGMGAIRQHIAEAAQGEHWQLDDDLKGAFRREHVTDRWQRTTWTDLLAVAERYADQPEVGLAGPVSATHILWGRPDRHYDVRVGQVMLVRPGPWRWQGVLHEDTDYCLQVLTSGCRTLRFNVLGYRPTASNGAGGCSKLREEWDSPAVAEVVERWPGLVTSTTTKRGAVGTRVKWKAAAQRGRAAADSPDRRPARTELGH